MKVEKKETGDTAFSWKQTPSSLVSPFKKQLQYDRCPCFEHVIKRQENHSSTHSLPRLSLFTNLKKKIKARDDSL